MALLYFWTWINPSEIEKTNQKEIILQSFSRLPGGHFHAARRWVGVMNLSYAFGRNIASLINKINSEFKSINTWSRIQVDFSWFVSDLRKNTNSVFDRQETRSQIWIRPSKIRSNEIHLYFFFRYRIQYSLILNMYIITSINSDREF